MTDIRDTQSGDSPLRYSRTPHRPAVAYTGVAVCVLLAVAFGAGLPLVSAFAGDSPGRVAFDAALGLFVFCTFGWGAGRCLAQTRPGWAYEVRGSVYLENLSLRPPRRYDLATATQAAVTVRYEGRSRIYYLSLELTLPGWRRPRSVYLTGRSAQTDRLWQDRTRLMLALADALAENPNRAAVQDAEARLRWLTTASFGNIAAWSKAQRR